MKKIIAALGLTLLMATAAFAAYDFETITVADTAIGFTESKIIKSSVATNSAQKATCVLETAKIRFRIDGPAPTASVGLVLDVGQTLTLTGNQNIQKFLAIRTGASSGSLTCTYE